MFPLPHVHTSGSSSFCWTNTIIHVWFLQAEVRIVWLPLVILIPHRQSRHVGIVRVLSCVWYRHIRTSLCLHSLQYICPRPPHMSASSAIRAWPLTSVRWVTHGSSCWWCHRPLQQISIFSCCPLRRRQQRTLVRRRLIATGATRDSADESHLAGNH